MAKARGRAVNPYRVFLSHATTDKWLARTLCEKIESAGASTFRDDRDIDGGDDIPESIRRAIGGCHELVVLLTPASVARPWVLMEVGAAWQRGKAMRIVALKQHIDVEPIPAMLKSKRLYDLNDFDQYLEGLRVRIGKASE